MPSPLEPQEWKRILHSLFLAVGLALLALLAAAFIHARGASVLSRPAPGPIDFSTPLPG